MHIALRAGVDAWAKDIHEKREILGADIVVFFWGARDTPDNRYAGQGATGSNFASVWGKFATVDSIIEHELGHDFSLPHNDGPDVISVMNVTNIENRNGYTIEESAIIDSLIPGRDAIKVRDSDAYLYNEGMFTLQQNSPIQYQSCDQFGTAQSTWVPGVSQQTAIGFTNNSHETVKVYWIGYSGEKNLIRTLKPGEGFAEGTGTTNPFLVEVDDECVGIVTNLETDYEIIEIANRIQYFSSDAVQLDTASDTELNYATCFDSSDYASTWTSESESTTLIFENNTSDVLNVYWLDYSANKVLVNTIPQGQSGSSTTGTTHPFSIEANGNCVGAIMNRFGNTLGTVTLSDR